jgi:hypothetical protein
MVGISTAVAGREYLRARVEGARESDTSIPRPHYPEAIKESAFSAYASLHLRSFHLSTSRNRTKAP